MSQAFRKSLLFLAVVGSIFPLNRVSYAGDPGHHHKHGRYREWLQLLSEEDRAKYKTARAQALKDPAVAAARERKKKADTEYRSLLNNEVLKVDPSLKPMLDKLSELDQQDF